MQIVHVQSAGKTIISWSFISFVVAAEMSATIARLFLLTNAVMQQYSASTINAGIINLTSNPDVYQKYMLHPPKIATSILVVEQAATLLNNQKHMCRETLQLAME